MKGVERGARVHLADCLLQLRKDGVLNGNGPVDIFRSTVTALAERIEVLREKAEVWGPVRHLPVLRTKGGRRRRLSLDQKCEVVATAQTGEGRDAARLSTAVKVWGEWIGWAGYKKEEESEVQEDGPDTDAMRAADEAYAKAGLPESVDKRFEKASRLSLG